MNALGYRTKRGAALALFVLLAGSHLIAAPDRIQVELYGGLSFLNPKDLNLFSQAEEEYNKRMFLERLIGDQGYLWEDEYSGYFLNEFPRITSALPAGFRIKFLLSPAASVSVSVEGFRKTEEASISGTITRAPSWRLTESKAYDPYRLELRGVSVLGGFHYGMAVGRNTELEAGLAAGWTWAAFNVLSSWTQSIELWDETGFPLHRSTNGHRLEGDGHGNGFIVRAMIRLNRALGKRWGFFVEASASYSRLKSLHGGGRESSMMLPGATTWEGDWGIKKEVVSRFWDDAVTLYVPTNYWDGWVSKQYDRDFVLNLSAVGCGVGLYYRF
jgi:hypothetical protein